MLLAEGYPGPSGKIISVKKVVIALHVFVWQAYCWYIYTLRYWTAILSTLSRLLS